MQRDKLTYLYDVQAHKHEQTKLMWRPSVSDEDYLHVDILLDNTEQADKPFEKSYDDILNLNKYTCYICNIEVPKTYATEHNKSTKHRTCIKIANIALKRSRKQMQLDIAVRRKLEVLDTYFCEPCAAVVLHTDKDKHETTRTHKISLKHDELLKDMLKIYEDIDNVEVISEIDDLELLKQRIEQEYLLESTLQHTDIPKEKTRDRDTKTVDVNSEIEELLEQKLERESLLESKLQNTDTHILKGKTGDIDTKTDEVNSEINKLKLLKQRIEQEYVLESRSQDRDAFIFKEKTGDIGNVIAPYEIKEVSDAIVSQLDATLEGMSSDAREFTVRDKIKKRSSVSKEKNYNPTNDKFEMGDFENVIATQKQTLDVLNSEIDTAKKSELCSLAPEIMNTAAIKNNMDMTEEKLDTSKKIKLYPITVVEFKNPIENTSKPSVMPKNVKLQKRALKKIQLANKKERSHNIAAVEKFDKETLEATKIHNISLKHDEVLADLLKICKDIEDIEIKSVVDELNKEKQRNKNIEINNDTVASEKDQAVSRPENTDNNITLVVKQANNVNTNESYTKLTSEIETIMSKYFKSNCTIDALNNNTEKEHSNNKVNNNDPNIEISHNSQIKFMAIKDIHEQNEQQSRENKETNNKSEQNKSLKTETNENNISKEKRLEQNKKNLDQNMLKVKNKKQDIKNQPTTCKEITPQAPSFNLVYYLKDLSRRCEIRPIHTIEAITNNIVQITAINGDKFKVLVNYFHSFHVKSNDIYCKVCQRPNVRRPEWHIIESEHRAKVMTPIKDLNGIRQLDDNWSHCILCNDLTQNVEFHLQSLHHKTKIKQTLVEPSHNSSDEEHQKAHEKKQKLKKKKAPFSELMIKNNLAMTSKGLVNCIICDVLIDHDLGSITHHINSFEHLDKFELKMYYNKVANMEGERFYCMACDKQLAKIDLVSHCNGKKHSKLVHEFLTKQEQENTDETIVLTSISQSVKTTSKDQMEASELICFVCNIIIQSIDEHTDTFDHKKSYLSYLESNKLNEIAPDTFYCIPCNTVIGIDYLMTHCMSKKHKRILKCFLCRKTGHDIDCEACNIQERQGNADSNVFNKEGNQDNTDCNIGNKQDHQNNTDCNVCNKQEHHDNTGCNICNKENTDCNVGYKQNHQDKTDGNVCNKEGHQDNTDCNVCDKEGHQDNIDCNIGNKQDHQNNTDCNVCDKQGHQDNTNCNVCNKQEHHENTGCNICNKENTYCNVGNKQNHPDNTDGNVCNKEGHQDNMDCNVCDKEGHQDNTDFNLGNKRDLQDNTDCNVCNKQGHQDNTDCNVCIEEEDGHSNETESQLSASLSQSAGNVFNVAMPLKVLYQFQEIKSSNNLLCTVCHEEVLYTRKSALYHVSTLDHIVAFNLMMLWNKIKRRDDKYFCDICLSDITYFSEICHVLGHQHTFNLAKQPKGTVYEYDNTLLTHSYAMSHKAGDRVRPSPVVSVKSLETNTKYRIIR